MALRALFFSRNPDTVEALSPVLQEAGLRVESCSDVFTAIDKGTKQPFACVIVDWVDQPEAGFLLKRARESGPNRNTVAIAVVDRDPSPEEEREHRLEFLIYRPISGDEARAVLGKARQQMQLHAQAFATDPDAAPDRPDLQAPPQSDEAHPDLVAVADEPPDTFHPADIADDADPSDEDGTRAEDFRHNRSRSGPVFRNVAAILIMAMAAYFLWAARPTIQYLATTKEGVVHVLKESIADFLNANPSSTQSIGSLAIDAQQDAYFNRHPAKTGSSAAPISVVSTEAEIPDSARPLRPAFDFPLTVPVPQVEPLPQPVRRAPVPESLRSSAPITPPPSLTVTPGQIMPVSTPPPVSPIASQYGDSIHLTEEAARALAIHTVDPAYPAEARPQRLQGAVVLQTVIARDGTVQEVRLVRGYFLLAKAAIAAVKQWRFKPSTINGRPVEAQTVITVSFTFPAS